MTSGERSCSICGASVNECFSAAGVDGACRACASRLADAGNALTLGRAVRGIAFGAVAAVLGAGVWGAIIVACSSSEGSLPAWWCWLLSSVLLGVGIGECVFKGSRKRGGLFFQVVAALLTLAAIGYSLAPIELQRTRGDALGHVLVALLAPVDFALLARQEPSLLLFVGIALYNAVRATSRQRIEVVGPLAVESRPEARSDAP